MKYKKIIFDLDNTVMDFSDAEARALKQVVLAHDLPYTKETVETYKDINHDLWRKLEKGIISREELFSSRFALFLEKFGLDVNGKQVDSDYSQQLGYGFKMMAHARELMTVLKRNGYSLYAGTNGVTDIQWKRMKGADITHFFDDVFISEEIGVEKPDPRFFDHIFDALDTDNKEEFLMVGDSLTSDILGANNAGIDSVWYNFSGGPKKAGTADSTYTITSLLELFPFFGLEQEAITSAPFKN